MSRREFPPRVRIAAFERAGGICEHVDRDGARCATKLRPGDLFYDHIVPDALGGEPTLDNCQCLCRSHHDPKTFTEDVPRIAKMKRQRAGHISAKPKYPWPKRAFGQRRSG